MGERYSRYLIASSGSPHSDRNKEVEIVDLSDPSKNCILLDDIQPREAYGYAGGLLGKNPVVCGRRECIVFGTSQKEIAMTQRRAQFSAVSLNSSTLWLLGKDYGCGPRGCTPGGDSTEFISLSEGRDVTATYKHILKERGDWT